MRAQYYSVVASSFTAFTAFQLDAFGEMSPRFSVIFPQPVDFESGERGDGVHSSDVAVLLSRRLHLLYTDGSGKLSSMETHKLKAFFEDGAPKYSQRCQGNARYHAGSRQSALS